MEENLFQEHTKNTEKLGEMTGVYKLWGRGAVWGHVWC